MIGIPMLQIVQFFIPSFWQQGSQIVRWKYNKIIFGLNEYINASINFLFPTADGDIILDFNELTGEFTKENIFNALNQLSGSISLGDPLTFASQVLPSNTSSATNGTQTVYAHVFPLANMDYMAPLRLPTIYSYNYRKWLLMSITHVGSSSKNAPA